MASGPSFRLAGIPVRIDASFLLIAVLLGVSARSGTLLVSWVAIVTGSVLLHELGHAIAFRRYGQRPQILLQGMGGLTSGSGPLTPARDVVVSLAGPLTGLLLLGLPALWLSRSSHGLSPTWKAVLSDLVFVNLAWSVLNLLPVLPLDGGRVSAALLSLRNGEAGERQAYVLSAVVAGVAGVVALVNGYTFGAMFAGFFAAFNLSRISVARNAGLQDQVAEGWRSLGKGDTEAAANAAQRVLADRPSAALMVHANELLAWSRLAQEDPAGARTAIERYPPGETPDPMLLAALELDAGRSQEALDHAEHAYRQGRFGPAAAVVANALAKAGLDTALADRLLADQPGADQPGGDRLDADAVAGRRGPNAVAGRRGPNAVTGLRSPNAVAGPDAAAHFAAHLHVAGRFSPAVEIGQRALDAGAHDPGQVAYNLACSHARSGQEAAAFDWLDRAVALGFRDLALLERDPDLGAFRDDDRYRTVRRRLKTDE